MAPESISNDAATLGTDPCGLLSCFSEGAMKRESEEKPMFGPVNNAELVVLKMFCDSNH